MGKFEYLEKKKMNRKHLKRANIKNPNLNRISTLSTLQKIFNTLNLNLTQALA
jgi:hypothetical protein